MSCPMVAVHQGSMQLAVGRAGWAHSVTTAQDGSPAPGPSGEPISVHDLTSGRKKRAMHFRSGDIAPLQHACWYAVHPCSDGGDSAGQKAALTVAVQARRWQRWRSAPGARPWLLGPPLSAR